MHPKFMDFVVLSSHAEDSYILQCVLISDQPASEYSKDQWNLAIGIISRFINSFKLTEKFAKNIFSRFCLVKWLWIILARRKILYIGRPKNRVIANIY